MYASVFDLEKAIMNLAQEDKNDQFERLIKQDIAFFEQYGCVPCITATTNSLLAHMLKIKSTYPSIPSLSSLAELQSDHLKLVERSRSLIVFTKARQLVPVNLSILLQHADLYSVPVLILIDGITELSNPMDFNATEQLLKEMPGAKFSWLDLQSIPNDQLIEVAIDKFIESQSIEVRSKSLCELRTKSLIDHLNSRLGYLSNYSKSLSEFKSIVDDYEQRSILLVSGAFSNSKVELYDVIQNILYLDPDTFINQVIEYDNLENRITQIIQVIQFKIKMIIAKRFPIVESKMTTAIKDELKSTEQDLSKLALELSRSLDINVNSIFEKMEFTLCDSESLIEELNQVIDELVTAPHLMMLIAKYAKSIGSQAADLVESTINKINRNNSNVQVTEDIATEDLSSDHRGNQTDVESKTGQMIRIFTKALPEQIIINQLPNTIRDILANLVDGLIHKIDFFVANIDSEIQSRIPDMYLPIKNVIYEKRYNIQIRKDKINRLADELL